MKALYVRLRDEFYDDFRDEQMRQMKENGWRGGNITFVIEEALRMWMNEKKSRRTKEIVEKTGEVKVVGNLEDNKTLQSYTEVLAEAKRIEILRKLKEQRIDEEDKKWERERMLEVQGGT